MLDDKPASEEFWDAVIKSGSNVIDCGFCGRTHFVDDPGSTYEEGELEKLHKGHKKNPDTIIFHSDESSVYWGYINGIVAVSHCPCGEARKYEEIFWNNRHLIAEYLKRRIEKIEEAAKRESRLVEGIEKTLNK
jgi:hypothetical protein